MRSVVFALLMLGACAQTSIAPPPSAGGVAAIHLSGTEWRRVDDTNANPHGATLNFRAGNASGYTGCRQWFAQVTQLGEALRFGGVDTVVVNNYGPIECGAEVSMATERSFLAVIEATRYAHYDQDALMLLDENQQVIAEFRTE
jgi:heat shock protein HslJ